ncbi:hypothetical protein [Paraburkholderia sediminicola]|uniref:hypothetical protein n=1 Tax=Paraburkholderia sediminicola TaxID=458836 RepID=UPI0038B82CC3
MKLERYQQLRLEVCERGYAGDIEWAETVSAPDTAELFAREYVFVVCNSGMRAQIADVIFRKVMTALAAGNHPGTVFGHKAKSEAIWRVWTDRNDWYRDFLSADDRVEFLGVMPWIGPITKWHLAKNFGVDAAKPDRHLIRIAEHYGTTPQALCEALSLESGDRIGTVDYVIWRACNLGVLDSTAIS